MRILPQVALIAALALLAFGCGSSGGGTPDECEDFCDVAVDCSDGLLDRGDCEDDCEDTLDDAGDESDSCENAAEAFLDCIASQECVDLPNPNEIGEVRDLVFTALDVCEDEQTATRTRCF